MIPATIEEQGVSVRRKSLPLPPQKAEDSASTAAESDAGGSATSASNSDVEAGNRWRSSSSGLTRRGTVQVVGGDPEERLSAADSQDSFSALGTTAGLPVMSPGHIFDCGGSGECAVAPPRRW